MTKTISLSLEYNNNKANAQLNNSSKSRIQQLLADLEVIIPHVKLC